jgi:hypothetical protein
MWVPVRRSTILTAFQVRVSEERDSLWAETTKIPLALGLRTAVVLRGAKVDYNKSHYAVSGRTTGAREL